MFLVGHLFRAPQVEKGEAEKGMNLKCSLRSPLRTSSCRPRNWPSCEFVTQDPEIRHKDNSYHRMAKIKGENTDSCQRLLALLL